VTSENYRNAREAQMLQAEEPIPLLRKEVRPVLPDVPEMQNGPQN
jgi:hypothetical protein